MLFAVGAFLSLVLNAGQTDLLSPTPGARESRGLSLAPFPSAAYMQAWTFFLSRREFDSGFLASLLAEHRAVIRGLPMLKPSQLQLLLGVLPRNS